MPSWFKWATMAPYLTFMHLSQLLPFSCTLLQIVFKLLCCLLAVCLSFILEHYATVTLTFIDKGNETELKIECRAVPESEEDRTRDGWQRYYCHAIKQTFGYGARLCWAQDVAPTVFDSTFWVLFVQLFLFSFIIHLQMRGSKCDWTFITLLHYQNVPFWLWCLQ